MQISIRANGEKLHRKLSKCKTNPYFLYFLNFLWAYWGSLNCRENRFKTERKKERKKKKKTTDTPKKTKQNCDNASGNRILLIKIWPVEINYAGLFRDVFISRFKITSCTRLMDFHYVKAAPCLDFGSAVTGVKTNPKKRRKKYLKNSN